MYLNEKNEKKIECVFKLSYYSSSYCRINFKPIYFNIEIIYSRELLFLMAICPIIIYFWFFFFMDIIDIIYIKRINKI